MKKICADSHFACRCMLRAEQSIKQVSLFASLRRRAFATMPREKQRRGRANKNKDSGISMSKDDIKREIIANRPKPALPEPEPELEEQAQQDFAPDGDEDKGDGWPELDHDSRAYCVLYWECMQQSSLTQETRETNRGAHSRVGRSRGHARGQRGRLRGRRSVSQCYRKYQLIGFPERKLLLRAALQNLAGQELALATDVEASIILERLLHSMDDFAKRVLAEAFAGRFVAPLMLSGS